MALMALSTVVITISLNLQVRHLVFPPFSLKMCRPTMYCFHCISTQRNTKNNNFCRLICMGRPSGGVCVCVGGGGDFGGLTTPPPPADSRIVTQIIILFLFNFSFHKILKIPLECIKLIVKIERFLRVQ